MDNISGQVYSTFTIENTSTGILIVTTALPDNNNITSGNSQSVILSQIFTNPNPSQIIFTSTITSELGDVDIQTFNKRIDCTECNGDVGGSAF